jgi:hypothetical protein
MNGRQPFVYILSCGCVFSQSGAHVEETITKKKGSPEGHSPSSAPGLNLKIFEASWTLAESLAAEEVKRKAGMRLVGQMRQRMSELCLILKS